MNSGSSEASTLTSLTIDVDIDCLFVSYDQSGSQGNLCDSWADDGTPDGASGGQERRQAALSTSKIRALPAEYPFQANLGLPQNSINFDLTHKRGKFYFFLGKKLSQQLLIFCNSGIERLVINQIN